MACRSVRAGPPNESPEVVVQGNAGLRRLGWSQRQDSQRASAAVHDLQRGGEYDRSGRWELIEVLQARQPQLSRAVHDRVVGKRGIEAAGLTRVGSDRLDTEAENVSLARQELRALCVRPGRVRADG